MRDTPTITAAEAARRLGLSRQGALMLVRRGRLKSEQAHRYAPHRISASEVAELLARRASKTATRPAPSTRAAA